MYLVYEGMLDPIIRNGSTSEPFQMLSLDFIHINQANFGKAGTDLSFVVEANTKALQPKLSQSRLVKMMNRGRVIWGQVEYRVEY